MRQAFSYRDVHASLRRHRFLIPGCVLAALALAFLWLNLVTPQYTAETVIGPTSRKGVAARGIRLEFQDIAQEKIRTSPNETSDEETLSDFARAMQLLLSPEIAAVLLKDKELAVGKNLFPHDGMDGGMGFALRRMIWGLAGQSVGTAPDAASLAKLIRHELHIDPVGHSAMRKLWLRHPDRAFGVRFLNALVRATDIHLRRQAKSRTELEIAYLRVSLAHITQSDQRRALTELLAAQEQTQLLLSVDLPFAADQIESAQAPVNPDWPDVGLTLFMALALGLFSGFSTLYALAVRQWLNQSPSA